MRSFVVVCSAFLSLIALGCTPPVTTASPPAPGPDPSPSIGPSTTPYREVMVGALVNVTGSQAITGKAIQAGLEIALEDVNHYLSEQQASVRLKLLFADGATDNGTALAKLQSFHAQGIKLVIGPDSSDNLAHLKDYADQHGIVLISPSSTAPSLALEDNVIRTAPMDIQQARALSMFLHDQAIRSVVTLHRDDTWAMELNQELSLTSAIFSMTLVASQSYPTTATSYSSAVASLSSAVSQAISQVGTSSVAVGLLSFDEAREIFLAAKDDPALKAVRWFGCDGNALSPALTADAAAAAFAAQTKFTASTFLNPFDAGNPEATRSSFVRPFDAIKSGIRDKLGGTPTEYAYTAYDSLWLAGLACKKLDGFPLASEVVEAIWHAAYEFRGASGAMRLSPTLDRTQGDYGFFGVQGNAWVRRAIYHDTIDRARPATDSLPILTYEGVLQ